MPYSVSSECRALAVRRDAIDLFGVIEQILNLLQALIDRVERHYIIIDVKKFLKLGSAVSH